MLFGVHLQVDIVGLPLVDFSQLVLHESLLLLDLEFQLAGFRSKPVDILLM